MSTRYYQFKFRPYSRAFRQPLLTHHGVWRERQGIILQFTDTDGRVGWGEVAPMAWFGTENTDQALDFCRSLPSEITTETITQIPDTLPACQFGLEAAREMTEFDLGLPAPSFLPYSYLLPTGVAALQAWRSFPQTDAQTFKWKIGVAPIEKELEQFQQLIRSLPIHAHLRLDANGGLKVTEASRWLQQCDALRATHLAQVEFLEQPLPINQFNEMLELSRQFATPIALDESVTTLAQLKACYQQGWRGIFVIKAAIIGSPQQVRNFCQRHKIDIVWSSVFETPIAQRFIQDCLIPSIPSTQRAIGFGVNQWFTDSHWDQLGQSDFEQLWWNL